MSHAILQTTTVGLYTFATMTLLCAALHDLAFRTIPNWMAAALALAAVVIRTQDQTLPFGLLAGLLVLVGTALCWHQGWLGGGDVKLLAATAMLVPPSLAANLLLDVAVAGGVLALTYCALGPLVRSPPQPRPAAMLGRIARAERRRIGHRGPLPYAVAIVAGTFFVLLRG